MAKTIDDLGAPIGEATADGDALVREFDHGTVSVDPSTHLARIRVNNRTVTNAPPEPKSVARFYIVVVAAAVILIGGFAYGRLRR
jgi:hypothetical protein